MSAADAKHAAPLVKLLKESGLKKADIPKELRQMAKLMAPSPAASAAGAPAKPAGGLYD